MMDFKQFMGDYHFLFRWHSEHCQSEYQKVTKTEVKPSSIRTYMPPFSYELENTLEILFLMRLDSQQIQ